MKSVALVGAGLVGSLLAIYLSRRGMKVDVYERRPDMRKEKISAGRSINLAISTRGIHALARLGLDKEIMAYAVPMRGRMMHSLTGELTFQPYGMDDSYFINSISRATLNKELMTAAESTGAVQIQFHQKALDIDFSSNTLVLENEEPGNQTSYRKDYDLVIGTDGSASAIRHAMTRLDDHKATEVPLDYGYKELVVLPNEDGSFKLEKNALHIWPRGNFMLIALPNFEGSFTCTLFLPWNGPVSFEHLNTESEVKEFFETYFKDAVPLIDNLVETFMTNPTGHMVTVKTRPWNVGGKCLLVGDAAHGIVPFFGQGMNCGFEDCTVLDEILETYENPDSIPWDLVFDRFVNQRQDNTDAIADMAVENFVEMRDKVADKQFLLEKGIEKVLQNEFPGRYVSRYSLVTFSNVPYKLAYDAGVVTTEILGQLTVGITSPDQVDLALAEKLIEEKLAPVLAPYKSFLAHFQSHTAASRGRE